MRDATVKHLSRLHTALYRMTRGVVGTRLVANDMLLLATTGRRTGNTHTVPLLYLTDGQDYVVIASFGGRPDHPEWYGNLVATPAARITVGARDVPVTATTMGRDERDAWWPRVVAAYGDYAVYQSRTRREIPLVRLTPDAPRGG